MSALKDTGIYVRKLKSGGWELAEDHVFETGVQQCPTEIFDYLGRLIISMDIRGRCVGHAGYRFDGCSGGVPDNDKTMTAACQHDIEYQMGRNGEIGPSETAGADRRFSANYIRRGGSRLVAAIFVRMLRAFGQSARRYQDDAEAVVHYFP